VQGPERVLDAADHAAENPEGFRPRRLEALEPYRINTAWDVKIEKKCKPWRFRFRPCPLPVPSAAEQQQVRPPVQPVSVFIEGRTSA